MKRFIGLFLLGSVSWLYAGPPTAAMENEFLNKLMRSVETRDHELYRSLICEDGELNPRDVKNNLQAIDSMIEISRLSEPIYRFVPMRGNSFSPVEVDHKVYEMNLKVVQVLQFGTESNCLLLPLGIRRGKLLIAQYKVASRNVAPERHFIILPDGAR
jgi:hypothetical protein